MLTIDIIKHAGFIDYDEDDDLISYYLTYAKQKIASDVTKRKELSGYFESNTDYDLAVMSYVLYLLSNSAGSNVRHNQNETLPTYPKQVKDLIKDMREDIFTNTHVSNSGGE